AEEVPGLELVHLLHSELVGELLHGRSALALDCRVAVGERQAEGRGQRSAHGRLSAAHQADQHDVANHGSTLAESERQEVHRWTTGRSTGRSSSWSERSTSSGSARPPATRPMTTGGGWRT